MILQHASVEKLTEIFLWIIIWAASSEKNAFEHAQNVPIHIIPHMCSAKATHIFSAKNIRIVYIESAKTVNEMNLNELVKLTTL